jgi:hypothetical protein
MFKRSFLVFLSLVILGPAWSALAAAPEGLVVYWPFDEGQGTVATDLSGNGNHGTVEGGALWIQGVLGTALQFNGVDCVVRGAHIPFNSRSFTQAMWINPSLSTDEQVVFAQHQASETNVSMHYRIWGDGRVRMGFYSNDLDTPAGTVEAGNWYHVTFWYDFENQNRRIYINGELSAEAGAGPYLGASGDTVVGTWRNDQWFNGMIDDVQIYDRPLTDSEVVKIMAGLTDQSLAQNPRPSDQAIDVPRDVVLAWDAGEFAATHDVYFGTSFDDVNEASRANPMGVLLSQGQAATSHDPAGLLDFETDYFWRVDEVNAAPDNTIFKGEVWSFTTELFAYPVANIIATSNGDFEESAGPENTVDGSGIGAADQHSTEASHMFLAYAPEDEALWIQYEFDRVYKLHEMLVWNYNVQFELLLGFGLKDITVEYSVDGEEWTSLGDVEFAQATARATYLANTTVAFDGVPVKYVRLTANSNWGGMPQFGLSEVRFLFIPAHAREPQPADGAANVSVDSTLAWRAGRDAVSHEVYFGTDAEALDLAGTVSGTSYAPGALNLATTYYWQVNAVQETESWDGAVWSFATQPYLVVDDFESYTDDIDAGEAIFDTWLDGWVNETGSTVGHMTSPFAERNMVRSGRQAMPLFYENTGGVTIAEAVREFATPQNWAVSGIRSLSLYFMGDPDNTGQLYVKIGATKVPYDGDPAALKRGGWQAWNIDLSAVGNVSNVRSLTIGVEGAGASGVLYIDDVRLYPNAPEYITPVDPEPTGLVAHYTFDEGSGTRVGDSSGYGNHGTVHGDPQWVAGVIGGAMAFDGVGDYVDCGNDASLVIRDSITISCWIKVASFTRDWETILAMGDDSYRIGRSATTGNSIHFGCNGLSGGNIDASTIVTTDTWRHVAVVYDGEYTVIYIDGIEDVRVASTGQINQSAHNLYIGENSDATGRYLEGLVDDVRIYNRPLSDGEIAGLSGQTMPRHRPF